MTGRLRGYSDDRHELTPRMRQILLSAARGASARQTAAELGVAEQTVKSVRAAACARLDAPNMVAAVAAALRRGDL
jgi:DNA-binding NarL/FixJ family response regulator